MPFTTRLLVSPEGDRRWRLADGLVYRGAVDTWTIPRGYVTDFASVPRVASWLIPTYGRWTRAAVVHDYLLTEELPAGRLCSADADGVFRRILRELGVSAPRRYLMWAGVRWGALFGGRADEWWRTALPVVAISALALAPVLVGGLAVLVGSAPLWLLERIWRQQPAPPEPGAVPGVVQRIPGSDHEERAARAAFRLDGTTWWDGDVLYWGRYGERGRPVDLLALEALADRTNTTADSLRAVLRDREAELLALKGPCSRPGCPLHLAHSGPCAPPPRKDPTDVHSPA